MDTAQGLKVVIVGAGVAGLAISHAFQKAKIDHVVLEKGVVAPHWGASITIWAHGCRILQQLGCLDALAAQALPMKMMYCRDHTGRAFSADNYFEMMTERLGYDTLTFERRNFLQIIYDALPDKSYIQTGKRVLDMIEDSDGVRVQLQDGSEVTGDLVIGCDGVHSICRELMWKNASRNTTQAITAAEKRSLTTNYRCLIGVSKTIPGLGDRDMTWVHNKHFSWLILTQPNQTYFFVHWKLSKPIHWPTKAKWSEEEAEKAAASVADHPVSDTVVFGEIWRNRIRGHLIGLEEGVFHHWYHGRTALVGDSVHKVTPNFALGANCALESAVVLVNKLVRLHRAIGRNEKPSTRVITQLFHEYQEERKPRMKEAFDASYLMTRLQAYDGLINHFTMRVMVPLLGQSTFANKLAELISGAPKFDFLPVKYPSVATTYQWKDEIQKDCSQTPGTSLAKPYAPGQDDLPMACWALQIGAILTLFWMVIVRSASGGSFDQSQQLDSAALGVNLSRQNALAKAMP